MAVDRQQGLRDEDHYPVTAAPRLFRNPTGQQRVSFRDPWHRCLGTKPAHSATYALMKVLTKEGSNWALHLPTIAWSQNNTLWIVCKAVSSS